MKPQDHVAAYGLTHELLILHDFTHDASVLIEAARQFKPKESALHDGSNPAYFNVPALAGDPMWARFQEAVNQTDARIADQYKMRRAEMTANALEAIANHVATIPGRKNLVWDAFVSVFDCGGAAGDAGAAERDGGPVQS